MIKAVLLGTLALAVGAAVAYDFARRLREADDTCVYTLDVGEYRLPKSAVYELHGRVALDDGAGKTLLLPNDAAVVVDCTR
jgi:hypothetical protein